MKKILQTFGLASACVFFCSAIVLQGVSDYSLNAKRMRWLTGTDSVLVVRPDSVLFYKPTNIGGGGDIWSNGTGDDIYYNEGFDGLVGIGTSTPGELLQVQDGNVRIRNDANNNFNLGYEITAGGTLVGGIKSNISTGENRIAGGPGHFLTGYTGGVERFRILTGGNFGIGTTTPTSTTHVNGSFALVFAATAITTDETLDATGFAFKIDATSGNVTVTLPDAATCKDRIYRLKRIDGSINVVTVDSDGGDIDGASTKLIPTQYMSVDFQSDGTDWFIF